MSSGQQLWVGYWRTGGNATLGICGSGNRALIFGSCGNDIAALANLESHNEWEMLCSPLPIAFIIGASSGGGLARARVG